MRTHSLAPRTEGTRAAILCAATRSLTLRPTNPPTKIKMKTLSKSAHTRRTNQIKRSMAATASACYMGGICPVIAFAVSHFQAPNLFVEAWTPKAALWLVTLGLLCYSAPLIVDWFQRWVGRFKAVGFVVAMETAMTFTDLYTAIPALLTLVALNGMILKDKFAND